MVFITNKSLYLLQPLLFGGFAADFGGEILVTSIYYNVADDFLKQK